VNLVGGRDAVASLGARAAARAPGALTVFFAALGPMVTVPAIRRLVIEQHGGSSASVHLFVAVGMMGAAVGAPMIAARVDARGDHLRTAAGLASIDALIELSTSCAIPTSLLFVLRPLHGMASMGLLALLFAQFRRSGGSLVAHAGSAMIAALALGPALGGILSKLGPGVPFRAAAGISALLAVILCARTGFGASAPRLARSDPGSAGHGGSMRETARPIAAPLLVAASQRFAIGGLVAAFAVQARTVHGLSDARVGACFSTLLVVFAVALVILGRTRDARKQTTLVPLGAALFGAAFVALAFAPRSLLMAALAAAGLGAAMVYAPCLALVSGASADRTRATSMALLHAAGALGMIAGPLVAAALDLAMRGFSTAERCAAFMALAGAAHALTAVVLSPRLRALADSFSKHEASHHQGTS
jgi:MFS family permease